MTYPELVGKVAVVTGAASGIGAATAIRLAAEGCAVYVADIDDAGSAAVVDAVVSNGHQAVAVHVDVSRAEDWSVLRARVLAEDGRLDVLCSNAYLEIKAPAHELAESDWDRQIAVSLKGAYLAMHTFVDLLGTAGGSAVIISSVHAVMGYAGRPAYAAAKGGLTSLTRQLAVDYGPQVRVNTILPGPILTPAWDVLSDEDMAARRAETTLKRLGAPEEIAAVVAFLASNDASYITGASLVVDGGSSILKMPS